MTRSEAIRKASAHGAANLWRTIALGSVAAWGLVFVSDTLDQFINPAPVPYRDVRDVSVTATETGIDIFARYNKTNAPCRFESLVVWGVLGPGRWPLDYEPIRATGQTANRTPGEQIMQLRVRTETRFDRIEVRTMHDCEGRLVDGVMLNAEVQR